MKSYAYQVFSESDVALLERATRMVQHLPDFHPHHPEQHLRCHEIARAVGRVLDLPVMDGSFCRCDHSWLYIRVGNRVRILDVYAVGSLPQVQLVDSEWSLPTCDTYLPGYPRTDIDEWLVSHLVKLMREVDSPEGV